MNTAQIIIYTILFILDFFLVLNHVNKSNNKDFLSIFLGHFLRIVLIWSCLIVITIKMNQLKKENPCPELEPLENVYKIK